MWRPKKTEGRLFLGGPFCFAEANACGAGARRLVLQRVDDRDVGFDLDGLAVENGWPVTPLADGVGSGAHEEWIAADHLQGLDRSVSGDDSAQFHLAFAMNLPRQRRILRLDALDQHGWF